MYAKTSTPQFYLGSQFRQTRAYSTGSRFGDAVIVLFLISQFLDGVFTYTGVIRFGPGVEANPIMTWLMLQWGEGPALAGAKVIAAVLGMALHLGAVHRVVFLLTAVYVTTAILPWTIVLFLL